MICKLFVNYCLQTIIYVLFYSISLEKMAFLNFYILYKLWFTKGCQYFTNNLQINFAFAFYVNIHLVCKCDLQSIYRQTACYFNTMEESKFCSESRCIVV